MRDRWPAAVYERGEEPDVRFTLANERTFLAWTRTALALVLAGAVLGTLPLELDRVTRVGGTLVLGLLGASVAGFGFWGWLGNERAMREGRPLPSRALAGAILVLALSAVAVTVAVVAVIG